ncbi:hypothetical protein [Maribacter ulvicola]|nr:hypothetical protein [Maribacter ulvicola]
MVLARIYEEIKASALNIASGYEKAAGRAPNSLFEMISDFKNNN